MEKSEGSCRNFKGWLGSSGDFGVLAESRPPVKKPNTLFSTRSKLHRANVDRGINLLVNLIQILSSCFQSELNWGVCSGRMTSQRVTDT